MFDVHIVIMPEQHLQNTPAQHVKQASLHATSGRSFSAYSTSSKLAVMADGPKSYTLNKPYHPLGNATLRHRSLQRRGWHVIVVPFFEWDAQRDDAARQEYVHAKVAAATA